MNDELRRRFPDLTPITGPPSLASINGIGTQLNGRRDFDAETGTYVATQTFAVVFVPLIAVRAYRVADAPSGGWYFVGRVPLSRFARRWNVGLLLAILALVGGLFYRSHVHSPDYLAGVKIADAEAAAADGRFGKAAEAYRDVILGSTGRVAEAKQKFAALLQLTDGTGTELAAAFRVAADLNRSARGVVPDLYATGVGQAEARAATDPAVALAVLEAVAPLATNPAAPLAVRRTLLERLTAATPDDPDFASKLAVVYEATGDRAKCEALLTPHAARLGTRDGAAVLGRLYAGQGKFEEAARLLKPYVDAKLPALRDAEARFTGAITAANKRVLDALEKGNAAGFDYAAYTRAANANQDAMVRDHVLAATKDDPTIRDARQAVADSSGVVPAALDLGLVYLQLGQATADPAVRTGRFAAAEQTFLSIRAFAGESDTFRLSLGQVYYWLGKPAEGKKEFDAALAAANRSTECLLGVAAMLREVGATTEARALAEEAHGQETDLSKKHAAARFRSLLFTDLDDDIAWLAKADPADPTVKASLASARGHKALLDGKDADAAEQYRAAIAVYATLPETAATLNNSALVHFQLAQVTNDPKEFAVGADKLDRAIALKPSDSILLHNSATVVLEAAVRDAVGGAVDLKALKRPASFDLLPFLANDAAGRKAVADRIRAHPGAVKARGYYEKLMLLAPKRTDSYARLGELLYALRDAAGLKAVADRAAAADLDRAQEEKEHLDYLSGAAVVKMKEDLGQAAARGKEALAAVADRKDATYAVAVARVVTHAIAAAALGEPADADAAVALAEKAFAAAPSDGSRQTLQTALAFRAHGKLATANAEYRTLAAATARALGKDLLDYVLLAGGPLADAASGLDDVKRWRAMLKTASADGADFGPSSWAALVGSDAAAAAAVAKAAIADESAVRSRAIRQRVAPYLATTALTDYFARRMAGRADAAAVLDDLRKAGVALPAPK